MKPKITITISGPPSKGRTTILEGLKQYLDDREVTEAFEIIDEVAPILVPLGPNRTRDGRGARVICNDREGGLPVIALFKSSSGSEVTSHHFADGAVSLDGTGLPSDLIGHLPPEPRKPREFQAVVLQDGTIADVRSAHPQMLVYAKLETITVREVLP